MRKGGENKKILGFSLKDLFKKYKGEKK